MASADFSWQALLRVSEMNPPHVHETSPVKDILFLCGVFIMMYEIRKAIRVPDDYGEE